MTSRDFCYWLQGFFEISAPTETGSQQACIGLTDKQVRMVRDHLALVFRHEIDPSYGDKKHQEALNKIHGGRNPVIKC